MALPRISATVILLAALAGLPWICNAQENWAKCAYAEYVMHSKDFQPVFQNRNFALQAWPGWFYMPWTWKWRIGYDDDSGRWSLDHGYNGAFLDHARTKVDGEDKLAWIDAHGLRFYVDHLAGKGDLHLWDPDEVGPNRTRIRSTGIRPVPLNHELKKKLEARILERIAKVKGSPNRTAYSLDDEISWGALVAPCMWRCVDDDAAYARWLASYYGKGQVPEDHNWTSYDAILPKLERWAIKDFDCSALMDAWTFNDSAWCNLLHDLVACANAADPDVPCGFVGAQSPSPFGGFDYARLMRKVQFIEAYDLGGSHSLIRSFNPDNALPVVTTHFHRFDEAFPESADESIWHLWYYLAHGNCGLIGWVDEGWFDAETGEPRAWHKTMAPHFHQAARTIGPLMRGAKWMHDGVAIYYNHASVQLGWILDAQAHGNTWWMRHDDHRHGASHCVRRAWEDMLRDEGLQYNYINYVDVIRKGIDIDQYRVLILPATLCLSDVEAQRIRAFCEAGGTVIADYMPGLWDQHGRGRKNGGVLDDLFGVNHDPMLRAKDVFQEGLWTEVDQDHHYDYETNATFLTRDNTCVMHESGFYKAVRGMDAETVRKVGEGQAVLMNLSPQMYNAYRERGCKESGKRITFMKHLHRAGLKRRVEVICEGNDTFGYSITYWKKRFEADADRNKSIDVENIDGNNPTHEDGKKLVAKAISESQDGRIILFLVLHPEITGNSLGERSIKGLKTDRLKIKLKFAQKIDGVRNERTGRAFPASDTFELEWKMNEAVVISFDAPRAPATK